VPSSGTVAYARTCSNEEAQQAPRFCKSADVQNFYDTAAELAELLEDTIQGSLGVSASSLTNSLALFQELKAGNMSSLKQGALMVADTIWDKLTGAGRLVESAGSSAVSRLTEGLPGASDRNQRIESKYFGSDTSPGNLLHTLSFQRPIGTNGQTSNAKERYQRYVMTCPCPSYDPAMEFANSKKWNSVVLWMVKKASEVVAGSEVLKSDSVRLAARGEGFMFHRNGAAQGASTTFWDYGVALKIMTPVAQVTCTRNIASCSPSSHCEISGLTGCAQKTSVSHDGWSEVSSGQLQKVLTPAITTGATAIGDIRGLEVKVYCGRKRDFGLQQGSEPMSTPSILECLKAGVTANAKMRAESPWKLYFPDEVVAMATFTKIENSACKMEAGAQAESDAAVCTSASKDDKLDQHLSASAKTSQLGDGTYQGMRTGVGWPKGAVSEVVMRPEDILQAAGIISNR